MKNWGIRKNGLRCKQASDLERATLIVSHCSLAGSLVMDFSGRHYPKDLILQTVRWYLRYSLSYRDMEEILEEPGVEIDHTKVGQESSHPFLQEGHSPQWRTGEGHYRQEWSQHRCTQRPICNRTITSDTILEMDFPAKMVSKTISGL